MKDFKWLQFSDLHFSSFDTFDTLLARKALLECLEREKFECDYVFITGDIAHKNKYENVDKHMAEIISRIAVELSNVFWSVGNHDIKRDSRLRKSEILRIRTADNPSLEFDIAMSDEETRTLLTHSGMSDYIREYKRIFGRELSSEEISDAHIYHSFDNLNLVVLNTCLTSCDDDDPHNLLVAESSLIRVLDKITDKNKPLIVIGHHNKEFLHQNEQEKIAMLFESAGVDLYLCGHSHRLGYSRFDDAGSDIHQITCGSGIIGNDTVFSFMFGEYDAAKHTVYITPYSYSDRSAKRFSKDFNLHRRLLENSNDFLLERLAEHKANTVLSEIRIPLEDESLFIRSQRYYDFLRSEEGRFSFLNVDEQIIPKAKMPETRVLGIEDREPRGLMDVLRDASIKDNMLIIGDGGMGKTTAMLQIWEELLNTRSGALPLYIPLNEYKPHPEFIRNYVKQFYGRIDIYELNRDFVLLLDGFNEASGDMLPMTREINALTHQKIDYIRIFITSRSRFLPDQKMDNFQIQTLQPLDDKAVKDYLEEHNFELGDTPIELLRTPMMLTLYTETDSIQKAIKPRRLFDFKHNLTRGELLYNYMLCQVANYVLNGRLDDVNAAWFALFAAAPYIAYMMEKSGTFHIDKKEFANAMSEFQKQIPVENRIESMPGDLQKLISPHMASSLSTEDVLIYQQALLVEEAGQYTFKHQYFRDFFAALHIANTIDGYIKGKSNSLPKEVSGNLWSIYVRDMLGGYYGDYRHSEKYNLDAHTQLHELLGKLRGKSNEDCGLAVNNIIETWRQSRNNRILWEDLSRLDLSHLPLNGVMLSSPHQASKFDGSLISDATFLPQGHSVTVNSAVYSPDGRRILSGADVGTIKEWDRETGGCLWTSPPYGGILISGCDFKGCRYTSPEIEMLVKTFGGRTLNPYLTRVRSEKLFGHTMDINISLGEDTMRNLVITGRNGSGKSTLLLGVKQALEAIFKDDKSGDVTLEFSGDKQQEAHNVLRHEYNQGYFMFTYFQSNHLYDETKSGLWDRLNKTHANMNQLRLEGKHTEAESQAAWLDKIKKLLCDLLETEVEFRLVKGELEIWHKFRGEEPQIRLDKLPDGYSATINIFSSILSHWTDISIPLSRMRGLILIDELEAHLHVQLQKTIFPFLTEQLPNVQFIVVTHSPFILNSVKNAVVFDMERDTVAYRSQDSKYGLQGWTLESILGNILGEDDESKLLSDKLKEFEGYIDCEDNIGASKIYRELHEMMDVENRFLTVLRLQLSAIGGLPND
ncbi:MAG: AAA family ATPase [Eubacteriaceae bacterium]|nr:AAA family ATPase [Eubacteriaceae bacterium]